MLSCVESPVIETTSVKDDAVTICDCTSEVVSVSVVKTELVWTDVNTLVLVERIVSTVVKVSITVCVEF